MSTGKYYQKKKKEELYKTIDWGKVILVLLFLFGLGYLAYKIKDGFDKKNKESNPIENIKNKTEDD